jgi:DNA-binding XRE family transcriptional regulator/mannose-6-phosphate isomerase-like protein (cupin superfamily)
VPATPKELPGAPERRPRPATVPSPVDAEAPGDRRQAHSQATDGIGERLRSRRTQAGLSLRRLARDLDLSASFLSQVENGKAQPSVTTLYLICSALELSIDELFAGAGGSQNAVPAPASGGPVPGSPAGPPAPSPVVTPGARRRLVLDSGVVWEQLSALHGGAIDFMFVRYDVGGSSTLDERLTRHSGVEYGYVMRGTLEVTFGFETYRMGPGDAISFDSSTPHRLSNVGEEPVEAVWFVHGRNTHP